MAQRPNERFKRKSTAPPISDKKKRRADKVEAHEKSPAGKQRGKSQKQGRATSMDNSTRNNAEKQLSPAEQAKQIISKGYHKRVDANRKLGDVKPVKAQAERVKDRLDKRATAIAEAHNDAVLLGDTATADKKQAELDTINEKRKQNANHRRSISNRITKQQKRRDDGEAQRKTGHYQRAMIATAEKQDKETADKEEAIRQNAIKQQRKSQLGRALDNNPAPQQSPQKPADSGQSEIVNDIHGEAGLRKGEERVGNVIFADASNDPPVTTYVNRGHREYGETADRILTNEGVSATSLPGNPGNLAKDTISLILQEANRRGITVQHDGEPKSISQALSDGMAQNHPDIIDALRENFNYYGGDFPYKGLGGLGIH